MKPINTRAHKLLTPMLDRCTECQVSQGRLCQCEGTARVSNGRRVRPRLTDTQIVWLLVVFDVAVLVGAFLLLRAAWKAWA